MSTGLNASMYADDAHGAVNLVAAKPVIIAASPGPCACRHESIAKKRGVEMLLGFWALVCQCCEFISDAQMLIEGHLTAMIMN